MTVAYVDIRKNQMPHASAITRIVQQLGGAFGTALVAVVLTAATTQTHPEQGFSAAFWWIIAITVLAALCSVLLPSKQRDKTRATNAPHTQPEVARSTRSTRAIS